MKRIDRLLLILILMMLSISTIIDTVGNQRLEDTVQKTDIIAQCLDPTSPCAKLTAEKDKRDREYFEKLMKVTNICTAQAARVTANQSIENLTKAYDECVAASSPPPPVPVTQETNGKN